MGAQSTFTALTENRGGTAPAGSHLYVGIDAGRRHHVVAAIVQERMENGSWERAGAHRIPTNGQGFRELIAWLQASGHPPSQVRIGCEPTGGWYAETVAAWLAQYGYEVWWLQNWAVHERRQRRLASRQRLTLWTLDSLRGCFTSANSTGKTKASCREARGASMRSGCWFGIEFV